MSSYEVERVLRALRSLMTNVVGPEAEESCACLDMFNQYYQYVMEENDIELLHSMGMTMPKEKCKGCDRMKGSFDFSTFTG